MLEVIEKANNTSKDLKLIYVKTEEDLFCKALEGYLAYDDNYCFNIVFLDKCIGNIVLNKRSDFFDGVFVEYFYIHKDYREKGFGKLVINHIKEIFENIYGESDMDALPFWEKIGAEFLDDNNLFVL